LRNAIIRDLDALIDELRAQFRRATGSALQVEIVSRFLDALRAGGQRRWANAKTRRSFAWDSLPSAISRLRWPGEWRPGTMFNARLCDGLTGTIDDERGEFRELVHLDAQTVQPPLDRCALFGVVSPRGRIRSTGRRLGSGSTQHGEDCSASPDTQSVRWLTDDD